MKQFRSKKILLSTVTASLLIVALAVVSFAWFINNYKMGGINVSTGNIGLTLTTYAYRDGTTTKIDSTSAADKGDCFVSGDYAYSDIDINKPATFFVKIEKNDDSLDFGYGLNIYLEGLMQSAQQKVGAEDSAVVYAGGFWYDIVKVEPNIGNGKETDALSALVTPLGNEIKPSLGTINDFVHTGKLTKDATTAYYKVTVGKNASTENVPEYTGKKLRMHASVSATQGNYEEASKNEIYEVRSVDELVSAIADYKPGAIINIREDILIARDLVFNRPVNLYVKDRKTLSVMGNFVYSFNSTEDCVIDTTGGGKIVVTQYLGSGGNFQISTPSSKITLKGSNNLNVGRGDIYVQRNVTLAANYNKGVVVDGFNIYSTTTTGAIPLQENIFKAINITNGGFLEVTRGTTVGAVHSSASDVKYLGILNNGTIESINLSTMVNVEDGSISDMPRIYIRNNGFISGRAGEAMIVIPQWAVRFVGGTAENGFVSSGNTRIIQDISGTTMTLNEDKSRQFQEIHIEHIQPEELVENNDALGTGLTVYYYNTVDTDGSTKNNSLKDLIESFFTKRTDIYPYGITDGVARLNSLTVITAADKFLTNDDYNYIKTLGELVTIDLSDAYTERIELTDLNIGGSYRAPEKLNGYYATIPKGAFSGLTKLKNVSLPSNTQVVRLDFAKGTQVREIFLPSTMVASEIAYIWNTSSIECTHAFPTAYYVHYLNEAERVYGATNRGGLGDNNNRTYPVYIVPEGLVADYEAYYGADDHLYRHRVVPAATLAYKDIQLPNGGTESSEYLVHNIGGDEWEIVYYRSPSSLLPSFIGASEDSAIYTGNKEYDIVGVGSHVFYNMYNNTATNLTFADSIRYIGEWAFGVSNNTYGIGSLDLNKVQTIGNYAFYQLGGYTNVLESSYVSRIGSYAFYDSDVSGLKLTACSEIGESAFESCTKLLDVKADACTAVGANAFKGCVALCTVNMPSCGSIGSGSFSIEGGALKTMVLGRPADWKSGAFGEADNKNYPRVKIVINASGGAPGGFTYVGDVVDGNFAVIIEEKAYSNYDTNAPFTYNTVIIPDNCFSLDNIVLDNGTPLYRATSSDFSGESPAGYVACLTTVQNGGVTENGAMLVGCWGYELNIAELPLPQSFTINGASYPLVAIGHRAFQNVELFGVTDALHFVLPDTVKEIKEYAFSGFSFDEYIAKENRRFDMGDGVEVIGSEAFAKSTFPYITVSKRLRVIDAYAFENSGLEEFGLANSALSSAALTVGEYAFNNSDLLRTVILPDRASALGAYAFAECDKLERIEAKGVTVIQRNCFEKCVSLDIADLRALSVLGNSSELAGASDEGRHFSNISGHLKLVRFGVLANAYARYTFDNAQNSGIILMHGVPIQSPVLNGGYGFINSNKTFTNGLVIAEKGSKTFYLNLAGENTYAELLEGVSADDVSFYRSADTGREWLYAVTDEGIHMVYCYATEMTADTILADFREIEGYVNGSSGTKRVISIGERCFQFTSLSGVLDLRTTQLKYVGANAFYNTEVTEIKFPTTTVRLGDHAFDSLQSLTSVSASGVTEVGDYAFYNCKALTTVSLSSVNTIGDHAFDGCSILKSGSFPAVESVGDYAFQNCAKITSFSMNSVKTVGDYAFNGCATLKTIAAENVISIGRNAFYGITTITSLYFPRLQTLGTYACYNCSSLVYFYAPQLTALNGNTFRNCTKLTEVDISNCASMGEREFNNCSYIAKLMLGPLSYVNGNTIFESTVGCVIVINGSSAINSSVFNNYYSFSGGYVYMSSAAYSNYKDKFNGRIVQIPEGKSFDDMPTYGEVQINGRTFPAYYYTVSGDTVTVRCNNAVDFTGERLAEDLKNIMIKASASDLSVNKMIIDTCVFQSRNISGDLDLSQVPLSNINLYAFSNNKNITKLVLPLTLTVTGDDVFNGCAAIKSVYAPGVTIFGLRAFSGCTALERFEASELTNTRFNFLLSCPNLVYFDAPKLNNVTYGLFSSCHDLAFVRVGGITVGHASADAGINQIGGASNRIILFNEVNTTPLFSNLLSNPAYRTLGILQNGGNAGGYAYTNVLSSEYDVSKFKTYGEFIVKSVDVGKYYYVKSNDGTSLQLLYCMLPEVTVEELMADLAAIESLEGAKFTEIGKMAFRFTKLTGQTFTVPSSVSVIGDEAFNNTAAPSTVANLELSNTVLVGAKAFGAVNVSEMIKLGDKMTTIGLQAFNGSASFVMLDISTVGAPKITVNAGDNLFASNAILYVSGIGYDTYKTGWANIPASQVELYGYANEIGGVKFFFVETTGGVELTNVIVSNKSITTLTIPNYITVDGSILYVVSFAETAFDNERENTTITTLCLPDRLNANAFDNYNSEHMLSGLTAYAVNAQNENFSIYNGVLFNKAQTVLLAYPVAKNDVTAFEVPSTVVEVPLTAIQGAKFLEKIIYT